jgi:hypothetical protein
MIKKMTGLKVLMSAKDMKLKDLACRLSKKTDISYTSLCSKVNGFQKASPELEKVICEVFNIQAPDLYEIPGELANM